MSADAKIWFDDTDDVLDTWHGNCDAKPGEQADGRLDEVLYQLYEWNDCRELFWYPRAYGDGKIGLVGYEIPRKGL
jgi:hypothetical protein